MYFRVILERDANDSAFLEQLHELQHKLQFVKAQEFKDAKAVGDVYDVVENLKYKVSGGLWSCLRTKLCRRWRRFANGCC